MRIIEYLSSLLLSERFVSTVTQPVEDQASSHGDRKTFYTLRRCYRI